MASSHRAAPIHVGEDDLADLRDRLHRTRWPDPLPTAPWAAGIDLTTLRELCRIWADDFDWRPHETWLNNLDPIAVPVDGVELHVFRASAGRNDAIPLLLMHGWPGSIVEFRHIIEPLTNPATGHPSFELVMPSLPGFGFGGKPAEPGWGVTRIAEAMHTLMASELGHARYGVAGGDWGAIIGSRLAQLHADSVIGFHTNLPLLGVHRTPAWADGADERERELLARWDQTDATGRAYAQVQSTKPQSLAMAQTEARIATQHAGFMTRALDNLQTMQMHAGHVLHAMDPSTMPSATAPGKGYGVKRALDPTGKMAPGVIFESLVHDNPTIAPSA